MQIMFGTILCVLLKGLVLTKATITRKEYTTLNILQEENVSMYPDLSFTEDISLSEKNNHHILNFKSDQSHSDSTVRNKREDDEVTLANISIIPESIESSLNKPTSLRAFVQFDSQFTGKVNDIFVTLRWNQPTNSTDEIILGYMVQCFFEDSKEIQICEDRNITTTELEHTVHNLTFNTTYYFRVRAHTKIVAGPYTDLINVSTAHENPIPKLLVTTTKGIQILDVDLNITNFLTSEYTDESVINAVYSIQERKIYWITRRDLITLKINGNEITKIASFNNYLYDFCLDWVTRNLYIIYRDLDISYIIKFDLTMWENGIIKFDRILKAEIDNGYLNVSPIMGILYHISYNRKNREYDMMKYHLDGKLEQIVQINSSFCLFHYIDFFHNMIIDNMNNEKLLIYWLSENYTIVTDINVSMCNTILDKKNVGDNINFKSMTIDKTNIYILAIRDSFQYILYVLKKKYASLKSVNADEYVEKILISSDNNDFYSIYVFDKYLQQYPPMRCLTPDEKVYNFEEVIATANSIIVNLPEPVVKSGCKKYNLPTTIYTISVSHCLDNNLNKSENFNVRTCERHYEIQNLTPFTEYKLKFTLSNFYLDQLSINPMNSSVILSIITNPGKLSAPENVTVQALTPTMAVVHWMPPKKVNCVAVTYEVHWKSVALVNGTQQMSKQLINMPKRVADGRYFTKINLSLPVQDYLIYVRVYPINFNDFYNEILSKIDIYSEPNNITLSRADINSMNISWISNINLTILFTLEYKDIAAEKWQTTNYMKMNYKNKTIYYIKNLQPRTSYNFRLILRYLEYEENFTWPADKRFIFSTSDIPDTPGIEKKYYFFLMLGIVIVIIICLCYFYCLYQRRSNDEQFFSSTITDVEMGILYEVSYQSIEFNKTYNPTLHYNPECTVPKIARKQIKFTKIIGAGSFGMVYQGKVKNSEKSGKKISVAIKTLRTDLSDHEKKKLLKEAELMNQFEHKHILRLLGICLDGISPFLVLELMETGDLLTYLRNCRNLTASDSHALRLKDLFAMCEDVARGCCYLEKSRIVHRDLACRNCLVSSRNREDRVIKIGDFGLARNIHQKDYYRTKEEHRLPVRWMAPESLMTNKFTSQSDVWSFGVLMWEITSLGVRPYYFIVDNKEVENYVREGKRLQMMLNCPSALYELMQRCWSGAADARPNFESCLTNIITLRENIEDASLSIFRYN